MITSNFQFWLNYAYDWGKSALSWSMHISSFKMFWWKVRFVSSNMTFQDMCLWLIKQWPCWTWKKMIKSKTFFPCLFSLSLWGFEWNVNTDAYVLRKNSIWLFVVNIHIFKFIFSPHPSSPLLSYFITK